MTIQLKIIGLTGFIAASLCATACGTASDAPSNGAEGRARPEQPQLEGEEDAREVASVNYADGRSVTFYAAERGVVLVHEHSPAGSAPLVGRAKGKDFDSVGLYERLSGETAPEALLEAAARPMSRDVTANGGARPAVENETVEPLPGAPASIPGSGVDSSAQALSNGLTAEEFRHEFCTADEHGSSFHWMYVTGRGSITRSDIDVMEGAVMANAGTVHWVVKYRPWYTWRNLRGLDISAGWYDTVRASQGDFDVDFRTTVDDADGDNYNMCTEWW